MHPKQHENVEKLITIVLRNLNTFIVASLWNYELSMTIIEMIALPMR